MIARRQSRKNFVYFGTIAPSLKLVRCIITNGNSCSQSRCSGWRNPR